MLFSWKRSLWWEGSWLDLQCAFVKTRQKRHFETKQHLVKVPFSLKRYLWWKGGPGVNRSKRPLLCWRSVHWALSSMMLTRRQISKLILAVLKIILQSCQHSGHAILITLCTSSTLQHFLLPRRQQIQQFHHHDLGVDAFIMTPNCTTQLNLKRSWSVSSL